MKKITAWVSLKKRPSGFVLLSTALLAMAGFPAISPVAWAAGNPVIDMKRVAEIQKNIHTMLNAWAQDHDQAFPDEPGDANANFRVLFQARLMDDETVFAIPHDGWIGKGKPDGNIGTSPDFARALEPGELSFAYVAGLDGASASGLPMLISGAGPGIGWITGLDRNKPAVPFSGEVAITYVDGKTELLNVDKDGKIMKMKNGKLVDIFSAAYGTNPEKIRLPARVVKK